MASIQKIRVRGRTYWRIVESRRVDGKPRPVPILHLGTADALRDRLLKPPRDQARIRSFQHGDVAALKALADRLNVVSTIDRHVGVGRRQRSVGKALLLLAMERALHPRTGNCPPAWAARTSLHRLLPGLEPNAPCGRALYDQIDRVDPETWCSIADDLTRAAVAELGIELDTLLYDAISFSSRIAPGKRGPGGSRREGGKRGRSDVRRLHMTVLVSRRGGIPLCSDIDAGDRAGALSPSHSLSRIRRRLERLSLRLKDVTLVHGEGKGPIGHRRSLARVAPSGFIATLAPAEHPGLMKIPVRKYRRLRCGRLGRTRALRLRRGPWGGRRTILLTVSGRLRSEQILSLRRSLDRRIAELDAWKSVLGRPRSGPRTRRSASARIGRMLSGEHLNKLLVIAYHGHRCGAERLEYRIDEGARKRLETEEFGKRILITDRGRWSNEEILLAHRGRREVEEAFRQIDDRDHPSLSPLELPTRRKVHFQVFIRSLALLLARALEQEARRLGYGDGPSSPLEMLAKVRLAMVSGPAGGGGGRPRREWRLEDTDPGANALFRRLVPPRPPFLYE